LFNGSLLPSAAEPVAVEKLDSYNKLFQVTPPEMPDAKPSVRREMNPPHGMASRPLAKLTLIVSVWWVLICPIIISLKKCQMV